jgi:cell division septation protein DedD
VSGRAPANPRRSPRAVNWLVTGATLLVLIAAGFSVGIVAGVVWEEPDLVMAYLSGETEEVAWSASAGTGSVDVAAAPERAPVPGPVDPQVRRDGDGRKKKKPIPAVSAPPKGGLAVQVGAFATSEAAERLADSLREKGFPVYVSPGADPGDSRWRVRVGPLDSREAAERAADRLKKGEKLPTWILSEGAS